VISCLARYIVISIVVSCARSHLLKCPQYYHSALWRHQRHVMSRPSCVTVRLTGIMNKVRTVVVFFYYSIFCRDFQGDIPKGVDDKTFHCAFIVFMYRKVLCIVSRWLYFADWAQIDLSVLTCRLTPISQAINHSPRQCDDVWLSDWLVFNTNVNTYAGLCLYIEITNELWCLYKRVRNVERYKILFSIVLYWWYRPTYE